MINMTTFTNVADNTVTVNGATFKVTDDVAISIMSLIQNGIGGTSQNEVKSNTTTPKKSSKKSTKSKKYAEAKDFTVPYEVRKADKGYVLGFSDRVPRDAYTVIANTVELENGSKWDKTLKGFAFKTKKNADEFAKAHALIASAEREAIRATWHKEEA